MTHIQKRVEIRTCIHCGETKEIVQRNKHASNICKECASKKSIQYNKNRALQKGKRVGVMGRLPYPLEACWKSPSEKFRTMAKKMFKIQDKEDWRKQIIINLQNAFENKDLMDWINSHNTDETTKVKRDKRIKPNNPDTRYMDWDEYERGLGEDSVDS